LSNLAKRVLTAVVAIPVILVICNAGGIYFFAFVAIASAVALYEFYRLTKAKGAQPLVALGILSGFFVNLSFYRSRILSHLDSLLGDSAIPFPSQAQFLLITLLVSVFAMGLVELFRNKGSAILNLSTTIFGVLYISLFFGTFIGIRELFTPMDFPMLQYNQTSVEEVYQWGGYTVISVLAVIWICDTAAFHVGKAWGKHKLFPRVSPNKSWEGAVFGFLFAVTSAVAAKYAVLGYMPLGSAVVIGIIVGVVGQLGDLVESLIKRDANVKDSSSLIPGHGGAFDRFDSLLLVSPLVYLYLDFVLFA